MEKTSRIVTRCGSANGIQLIPPTPIHKYWLRFFCLGTLGTGLTVHSLCSQQFFNTDYIRLLFRSFNFEIINKRLSNWTLSVEYYAFRV